MAMTPTGTLWHRVTAVASAVDPEERRHIFKAFVIGIFVWMLVYPLKLLVHHGFEGLVWLMAQAPSILCVFIPLALGALLTTRLSRNAGQCYYRVTNEETGEDEVHTLNLVAGDGLERAISLYYTSDPSYPAYQLGHKLTGRHQGVEARWGMPTLSLALRKWFATLCTLCSGGSGGLEASVSLIGESLAATVVKPRDVALSHKPTALQRAWDWWRVKEPDDLQTAQLCGIAAAIATLLSAPFAGAFFAVEVMYRRTPVVDKLIFALLSALVAFFLSNVFSPDLIRTDTVSTLFDTGKYLRPPIGDFRYFTALLIVTGLLTVVATVFRWLRSTMDALFHSRIGSPVWRHLIGMAITGLVVCLVALGLHLWAPDEHWNPIELVLGPGEEMVNHALANEVSLGIAATALAAKLIATLATITSGGSAGLLYPTMFFGAMVAAGVAQLFDFPHPVILIAPAMCASLVSIVNVPLAAILFTVEVFGSGYIVPALIALCLAAVITHKTSIYRAQRQASKRQVLPGISVVRMRVPKAWSQRTLADLKIRSRFRLTVIGMIDRTTEEPDKPYEEQVLLNPPPDQPLSTGDTLLMLGAEADLDEFKNFIREETRAESTRSTVPAPPPS